MTRRACPGEVGLCMYTGRIITIFLSNTQILGFSGNNYCSPIICNYRTEQQRILLRFEGFIRQIKHLTLSSSYLSRKVLIRRVLTVPTELVAFRLITLNSLLIGHHKSTYNRSSCNLPSQFAGVSLLVITILGSDPLWLEPSPIRLKDAMVIIQVECLFHPSIDDQILQGYIDLSEWSFFKSVLGSLTRVLETNVYLILAAGITID